MKEDLVPELQHRLEMTFEPIAIDPGITGDLLDDAAQVLLKWAENEVARLVAQTTDMPDEDAEAILTPKLQHLRRYLRRTARKCAATSDPAQSLRETLTPPDYHPQAPAPDVENTSFAVDGSSPQEEKGMKKLWRVLSSSLRQLSNKKTRSKGDNS